MFAFGFVFALLLSSFMRMHLVRLILQRTKFIIYCAYFVHVISVMYDLSVYPSCVMLKLRVSFAKFQVDFNAMRQME